MSARNVVQRTFDVFAKSAGGLKRSGNWYFEGADALLVLNLQKSNYSVRYYVNVGLWLTSLGPERSPKEHKCHLRCRLDWLLPEGQSDNVDDLLTVSELHDEKSQEAELNAVLEFYLHPLIGSFATYVGLRSPDAQKFVKKALILKEAQRELGTHGVPII